MGAVDLGGKNGHINDRQATIKQYAIENQNNQFTFTTCLHEFAGTSVAFAYFVYTIFRVSYC